MAERRMFAKGVIYADRFLDLPLSAQALYFHLGMQADDDGLVSSPKTIRRMVGAGDEDYRQLMDAGFLIPFRSGVCAITHWYVHNCIKSDRYKPSLCVQEKAQLEKLPSKLLTKTHGTAMEPQVREEEGSVGEESAGEGREGFNQSSNTGVCVSDVLHSPTAVRSCLQGELGQGVVMLSDDQMEHLLSLMTLEEFQHYVTVIADCELKGKSYKRKTHYQAILEMVQADRALKT